jgi:hypothetical protein
MVLSSMVFVGGLMFANAAAADAVARATFVNGDVQVRNANGTMRPLARGGELSNGDSIVTGANGSAQLNFADNSRLAVRPDSEVTVDEFKMSGNGSDEGFILRLTRGALRSITGLIGQRNKKNFSLRTPVATIGIRGTDFEAVHVPLDGGKAFGGNVDPGTYNKVYAGGTHLMSNAGAIDLNINETGFIGIGGKNAQTGPVKIDQLPAGILKIINAAPIIGKAGSDKPDAGTPAADGNPKPAASTDLKLDSSALKTTTLPTTTEITKLPTTTTINTSTLSTVNSTTLKTIDSSTLSTTTVAPATTTTLSPSTTLNTSTLSTTTLTTSPTTTTISPTTTTINTAPVLTSPTTTLKLDSAIITK